MTQNDYNFDYELANVNRPPEDRLNELWEWEDYKYEGPKPDLNLLALPVPKRFLTIGSVYWASPNVKYTFIERSKKHKFGTYISVKKYHNIDDAKLRLVRSGYLFLRDKDVMSEIKSRFLSLVYNVETKILYLRQFKSKHRTNKAGCITNKRNWHKSIIRLSINSTPLSIVLTDFDSGHTDKFMKDLKKIVSKDIPDVCDICKDRNNRITALILQHRIGRSLPHLNDICMSNLAAISKRTFISTRVNEIEGGDSAHITEKHDKDIMKLKNNSVYKFVPTLKETGSLKKAIKVILGECYVGIYPKLLFDLDLVSIAAGSETVLIRYKKQVPKSIQHHVIQSLKTSPMDDFKVLFKEVLDLARSQHVQDHVKNSWIKTVKRIHETIPWHTWADTYRMGGELGVRIRPNNFNNVQDIFTLHDGFSRLIRRNRDITNQYLKIDENTMFIEVDYPIEFEDYKFRQILTPKELVEESDHMGHCVHGYDINCIRGNSIIFSVIDPENKRWTVEYSGSDYSFTQAEGNQADNGGKRYFCPDHLVQKVFAPFTPILNRLDNHGTPYKMRCTLNLATINVKKDLYGLDKLIDLDIPEDTIQNIESDMHHYNCALEDLIHLNKQVGDKTLKVNLSPEIQKVLAVVENLNKINKKEQSLIANETVRLIVEPIPRQAQADATGLFPLIPAALVHDIQQEITPFADEF